MPLRARVGKHPHISSDPPDGVCLEGVMLFRALAAVCSAIVLRPPRDHERVHNLMHYRRINGAITRPE
jgi:hypothetical protein